MASTNKHMESAKKKRSTVFLFVGFVISGFLLFFYSYTQVDLSLTLSSAGILQSIQKAFQSIGYFQRPLATTIFVGITTLMFGLYGLLLRQIQKGLWTRKELWKLILVLTTILVFFYPAFSYDFFNYMFTAKTVLIYHKNPYDVIPLQFAGVDPWLNFMRWTHLPSAYTPFWILLTLVPYTLGFGYFLLIMWAMKAMVAGFYLLAAAGLLRVLDKLKSPHSILGLAIFAFNPLIIIETLVSGHNDIVMMAIVIWAIYCYLEKSKWTAGLLWAMSVGAKLMTLILAPLLVFGFRKWWALGLMSLGLLAVLTQREVLAWYWVWIMPFVALIPESRTLTILASSVSLGLTLRYIPYLYLGNWDPPAPEWKLWLTLTPIFLASLWLLVSRRRSSRKA